MMQGKTRQKFKWDCNNSLLLIYGNKELLLATSGSVLPNMFTEKYGENMKQNSNKKHSSGHTYLANKQKLQNHFD